MDRPIFLDPMAEINYWYAIFTISPIQHAKAWRVKHNKSLEDYCEAVPFSPLIRFPYKRDLESYKHLEVI